MNIKEIGFPINCFSECIKSEPNRFMITSSVAVAGIALISSIFMVCAKYKGGHAIQPLQTQVIEKDQQIIDLENVNLTLVQENETLKQKIVDPAQVTEKDQQITDLGNVNSALVQQKEELQQKISDPDLFYTVYKGRIEALEADNAELNQQLIRKNS